MDIQPPPRNSFDELPDYYCGRLILKDNQSDDNCRWIVYDGRQYIRCVSKTAAYRLAAEQANATNDTAIYHLMAAQHAASRASEAAQRAADESAEIRIQCEEISVKLRLLADKLDTIISQSSHENHGNEIDCHDDLQR